MQGYAVDSWSLNYKNLEGVICWILLLNDVICPIDAKYAVLTEIWYGNN